MSVVEAHQVLGARAWIFKEAMEDAFESALALGDVDAARRILAAVEAIPIGERSPVVDAAAAGYGARIAAAGQGAPEAIEHGFRQAAHLTREIGRPFMLARFQLSHAEWLSEQGRSDEATELAAAACEAFRALRAGPWITRAEAIAGVGADPVLS